MTVLALSALVVCNTEASPTSFLLNNFMAKKEELTGELCYLPWRGIISPKTSIPTYRLLGMGLGNLFNNEYMEVYLPEGWSYKRIDPPDPSDGSIAHVYDLKKRLRVIAHNVWYPEEKTTHTKCFLRTRFTVEGKTLPHDLSVDPAYTVYRAMDREAIFPEMIEFGRHTVKDWLKAIEITTVSELWMAKHYPGWRNPLAYWSE